MRSLRLYEECIALIMRCVKSVPNSVILNGTRGEEFKPSRGLRQGDPLSLYLFIICAEGFTRLIHLAKKDRRIEGISIGRGGLSISHLFFTDGSILFWKGYHGRSFGY